MATKTPAERAIADVEKAIKETDKAYEKFEAARTKADELGVVANRAVKTLNWTASHPDLPDDFNLDEFRRSLEAPFEEEVGGPTLEDVVGPAADVATEEELAEKAAAIDAAKGTTPDVGQPEDSSDAADEDDPWGED